MKKLLISWFVTTLVSFGLLAGGYHLYVEDHPVRVLVIMDSSFPMQASWSRALVALSAIDDRPYAEFSLFTEKNRVHGWQAALAPNRLSAYAPRNFEKLETLRRDPLFAQADEIVFVTNATAGARPDVDGWTILQVH